MNDKKRKLGPKAKELWIRFMSREAIPDGGDIADGARFFLDNEHRQKVVDRAWDDLNAAILAVRSAPDNPYGDDEETIAAAILNAVQEKKESKQ